MTTKRIPPRAKRKSSKKPRTFKSSNGGTAVEKGRSFEDQVAGRLERQIDRSQSRAIIRYALETNDPWLARLVRQADADGTIDLSEVDLTSETDSTEDKIKVLTEKICRDGEEPTAALLILMSMLENATHPKTLANTAKHSCLTRCDELNVYGSVDVQIAVLESELFAGKTGDS